MKEAHSTVPAFVSGLTLDANGLEDKSVGWEVRLLAEEGVLRIFVILRCKEIRVYVYGICGC